MTRQGFETFEHTADIGLRAWAPELKELFREAGLGLFSVMVDLKTVSARKALPIQIKSESTEELFLAWLKELLFIFDTKHFLISEINMLELDAFSLTAEVGGEKADPVKHSLGREVKAVTRHQFLFKEGPHHCLAEVILDI